jgi:hypothetical protein
METMLCPPRMKTVLLAAAAVLTLGLGLAHAETPTFPNTFFTQLPGVIAKPATGSALGAPTQTSGGQPVQLYPSQSRSGTQLYQPEAMPPTH